MYVPAHFAATDRRELVELMRAHAFATLVSSDERGVPFATHIPFVVEADDEGLTLVGHVARANPHRELLDREALVIFHGPHAYVSPSWYVAGAPAAQVPTWNYAAVHAYGRPRLLEDAELVRLLERLVEENEAGRDPRWEVDMGTRERRGLLRGIVGFAIEVTRLEGKLKLSQNRAPDDQRRVEEKHAAGAHPDERELAALMAGRRSRSPGAGRFDDP